MTSTRSSATAQLRQRPDMSSTSPSATEYMKSRRMARRVAVLAAVVLSTVVPATSQEARAAGEPVVARVEPQRGPDYGGTDVYISGDGFDGATAVRFGQTVVRKLEVSVGRVTDSIRVKAPSHAAGTVPVTVVTPSGTSAPAVTSEFTYYRNPPSVASMSPAGGPPVGGTKVVVAGDFLDRVTAVRFGSQSAAYFTLESPTRLVAVSPPQPIGTVADIRVEAPHGVSTASAGSKFRYHEGQWFMTGPMSQSRTQHALAVLDGPRCRGTTPPAYCADVLAVGGSGGTADLYDPESGRWRATGSPPGSVGYSVSLTLLDGGRCREPDAPAHCGNVLLIRSNGTTALFDPAATGTRNGLQVPGGWVNGPTMAQTARAGHAATSLDDGSILVVGGGSEFNLSTEIAEIYTPPSPSAPGGQWARTGDMSAGRRLPAASRLKDGRVLVAGGALGSPAHNTAEVYDPVNKSFQPTPPMPAPHNGRTAALLDDGTVLLRGEQTSIFDPAATDSSGTSVGTSTTGGWRKAPAGSGRTPGIVLRLLDGRVLVTGAPNAFELTEVYDPALATWATTEPMHLGRRSASGVVLSDGRVLVSGGYGGAETAELYVPHYRPPMSIDRVAPAAGSTSQPTAVTITGTALFPATSVHFGALPAGVDFNAQDELRVIVPPQAQGTVAIRVTTPTGTVEAPFTYGPGRWSTAPDAPECSAEPECDGRYMHSATVLGGPACRAAQPATWCGNVLVAGGTSVFFPSFIDYTPTDFSSSLLFDPHANAWEKTKSPMVRGRWGHTATVLDGPECHRAGPPSHCGKVLVVGGEGPVTEVELFDPQAGTWSETDPMPDRGRFAHTATLMTGPECSASGPLPSWCGAVLVAGGTTSFGGRPALASAYAFDPKAPAGQRWTSTEGLRFARGNHGAALLPSGEVLVAGGMGSQESGSPPLASTEIFNPRNSTWRPAPAMAVARIDPSVTVLTGTRCGNYCDEVMFAGGLVGGYDLGEISVLTSSVEVFDHAAAGGAGAWRPAPLMREARVAQTASTLPDGRVLVTGSGLRFDHNSDPYRPPRSAEIFDPAAGGGSGAWEPVAPMLVARGAHTATVLDPPSCGAASPPPYCGRVLVVGGAGPGSAKQPPPIASSEIYTAAPTVSGVTPTGGARSGGQQVTIIGTGFAEVESVTFGGVPSPGPVEVLSRTELRTPAPPRAPGPVQVAVITSGGTSATLAPNPAATFTYVGSPSAVRDLSASTISDTAVRIAFSAPHDGTTQSPATRYAIRRSTEPIFSDAAFDAATPLCGGTCSKEFSPVPTKVGQAMALNVSALKPGTTYHFAIKAIGADGALGDLSNDAAALTLGEGTPGTIRDLVATAQSDTAIKLEFSAPGSYGVVGPPPARYVVAQSSSPITSDAAFATATVLCDGECPLVAKNIGDRLSLTVANLSPGTTYHYAVRGINDTGRKGALSNNASGTTTGTPRATSAGTTCASEVVAAAGKVAYPAGYSLVGLPSGTSVPTPAPMYSWFDLGAGGTYSDRRGSDGVMAGRGYWAWFRCPVSIDVPATTEEPSFSLGAYRASMVGNPSGTATATVSGHDFAALWDPALNSGAGGYRISGYREPQPLEVGQGAWVFSYETTTLKFRVG